MSKKVSTWKHIKAWWWIHTSDPWVYRVYYKDGKHTYPLARAEAKSLAEVFNGVCKIDWEYAYKFV